MKKRKNPQAAACAPFQNPVAKYAHLFNKTQRFCDKSKYSRKAKHPGQEATPTVLSRIIGIASCFYAKQDFRSEASPNETVFGFSE